MPPLIWDVDQERRLRGSLPRQTSGFIAFLDTSQAAKKISGRSGDDGPFPARARGSQAMVVSSVSSNPLIDSQWTMGIIRGVIVVSLGLF